MPLKIAIFCAGRILGGILRYLGLYLEVFSCCSFLTVSWHVTPCFPGQCAPASHSPSRLHSTSLYGGQIWEASFCALCISSFSADVWVVSIYSFLRGVFGKFFFFFSLSWCTSSSESSFAHRKLLKINCGLLKFINIPVCCCSSAVVLHEGNKKTLDCHNAP